MYSCVTVWTACCRLSASMRLPCQFGCLPSELKSKRQLQKRLKLSIKFMLGVKQVDNSQVLIPRILLKLSVSLAMVGIGLNNTFNVIII